MVALNIFVMQPSMVQASPGLVALTIHTLSVYHQLIQPVPLIRVTKALPCVIMSVIMHVKDPYLSVVRVEHCVLVAYFCLSL